MSNSLYYWVQSIDAHLQMQSETADGHKHHNWHSLCFAKTWQMASNHHHTQQAVR